MNPDILYSPYFQTILIVSAIIKGVAMWRAARLKQRNWFIGLLVINLLGIPDVLYLFIFAEKKLTIKEIKSWTKVKR